MTNTNFSISAHNSYSLALYELAEENKILDQIEKQVFAIAKLITESEDFISTIKNPTLKQEDQLNIISLISEKFGLDQLLKKFVNFLIKNTKNMIHPPPLLPNLIPCISQTGLHVHELPACT